MYLDPPAGKHGFLQVTADGHFRFENKSENEKFVGVVNVAVSNYPTKEQARILAARMAKFGINLVRIHLIDVEWQYGLFENSAQNTLQISSERLDRMDYFIKCLKDRGIYFNFCIHAGRIYKEADGINAPIQNDQSKYVTLFDPKIIDLQKDFAAKTIGHVNPYTGLTYADDPAMANMELTNENSLFNGWLGWQSDYIFGDRTDGIGEYYSLELDSMFNKWLTTKYDNDSLLQKAWEGERMAMNQELVKNGSFESDLANWSQYVRSTDAQATINIDNTEIKDGSKSAKIAVNSPGRESWHVHLKTNNITVEKDQAYKLCFYAKSDIEAEPRVEIMENQTWKWIMGPTYKTSEEWKLYEIYFTAAFNSDALVAQFDWGKQTGTFWLDSVSITKTSGIGLENQESLALQNVRRTKSTEIGKFTKQRVGDNAEFYFHLEKEYQDELTNYLKHTLNVKCPITFTNNYYGLPSIYSQSQADYMDFHMYWDHPSYPNGWSNIDFTVKNKSMLLDPKGSTLNRMFLSKVKNKPFVLSEYNHAYPYIFQVEAPSLLYAYGSFFDLDGIIWHAYYDYMNRFAQREQDMFFDIAMHPVMMTQMVLALPFRMNYIKKHETLIEASYKKSDVFEGVKLFEDRDVINIKDIDYGTSFLKHGFAHANFESDSTFITENFSNPGTTITTETDELMWDGNNGFFTVNSPYWQGATGYLGNKNIELADITLSEIETTNNLNFAAIHLISLDSLPISKSKKLLLLTSARLQNEGLQWNENQTRLLNAGGNKALCEPVEALIKFKSANADSLMVYSLNERGERDDSLLINQFDADTRFMLNKKTLWYEISNHKLHSTPQGESTIKTPENKIKIIPNPGRQYSFVEYSFSDHHSAEFVLYNSTGRLINKEQILVSEKTIGTKKINLSQLDNGIYFCGFRFKNGQRIMKKLVVSK